jgi:hypothetical protein
MENSWTETCYQTLHFFFWEPQHLGKQKNYESVYNTPVKVMNHLKTMEVTLNHHLNTFLLLAPLTFRRRLFKRCFGFCPSEDHQMHDQQLADDLGIGGSIQPDFCFRSASSLVSLEMKITAKSSIEQFLKYLLLGLADEIASKHKKEHCLGFIGPDTFSALWKSGYKTPAELKKAAGKTDLAGFLGENGDQFVKHLPRFKEILASVNVGFITYGDLSKILKNSQPSAADKSEGAGVYRRLIKGLVEDLRERELV